VNDSLKVSWRKFK